MATALWLVVLTTEWLPWLQTSWGNSAYAKFILVLVIEKIPWDGMRQHETLWDLGSHKTSEDTGRKADGRMGVCLCVCVKQPEPKSYFTTDNPQNICEEVTTTTLHAFVVTLLWCSVVTISARSCVFMAWCKQVWCFHRCSVVTISVRSWLYDDLGNFLYGCLSKIYTVSSLHLQLG